MYDMKNLNAGFVKNNPVFVLLLGLTTALGVTSTLTNGLGMGIVVLLVLAVSSIVIGLLKKVTPAEIVIPVNLVIIAALVKIAELLVRAYAPSLADGVGIYLPLLAVNSVLLFGVGTFDRENGMTRNFVESMKLALGYLLALVVVSLFRELLATGGVSLMNPIGGAEIFTANILPESFHMGIFNQPAGAFIALSLVSAFFVFLQGKNTDAAVEGGK